jgi:WD40 repeat protein
MHTKLTPSIVSAAALIVSLCTSLATSQVYYQPQRLFSPNPTLDTEFGVGIAVDDNFIAVGAYRNTDTLYREGRVYLYDTTTGILVRQILTPGPFDNDAYGTDVAIEGNLLLVGAPQTQVVGGGAYLHNINTGDEIAFLLPNAPPGLFGVSVALQAPLALLGAPFDDGNGPNTGAVYAFLTTNFIELTKLTPDNPIDNERFGLRVAIDGNYLVVGAPGFNNMPPDGSVYVFDVATGVQLHRLTPPDGNFVDLFGFGLDIDNGVIAVGSPEHSEDIFRVGAVYLFDAQTGNLIDKINHPNPAFRDNFGYSVALEGDTLVVGAPGRDITGNNTGSTYVYNLATGDIDEVSPFLVADEQRYGYATAIFNSQIVASGVGFVGNDTGYASMLLQYCDADINADGDLNFFDVSAFLKFQIDFNNDGQFNFFDISAFLAAFSDAC